MSPLCSKLPKTVKFETIAHENFCPSHVNNDVLVDTVQLVMFSVSFTIARLPKNNRLAKNGLTNSGDTIGATTGATTGAITGATTGATTGKNLLKSF